MNQLIVLYGEKPAPDWLRGRPKYEDLPRLDPSTEYEWHVSVAGLRSRDIARQVQWVVDMLRGGWNLSEKGFGFETETDVVYFKLRWG